MHIHTLYNPQFDIEVSFNVRCVLTIGNFDGVHLGHQQVINALKRQAQVLDSHPAVMIFEPQPLEFFAGEFAPMRLMAMRDKVEALFAHGIAVVLVCKFDGRVASLLPFDFMTHVRSHINLTGMTLGHDFRFGEKRQGDIAYLKAYGKREVIDISVLADFQQSSVRVSSSLIRSHLVHYDFEGAQAALGRWFELRGIVQHGQKLARIFGFPTANLGIRRQNPPVRGVFVGKAYLPYNGASLETSAEVFQAVANCGYRPSLDGRQWRVEIHLLDLKVPREMYGQRLAFVPLKLLRAEKRFDSMDDLRDQIQIDVQQAIQFFKDTTL